MRPYYLGKKKVPQGEFDEEVKRLLSLGLKQNEIANRIRNLQGESVDRKTVWRAMHRLGKVTVAEVVEQGAWVRLTHDAFRGLPEILKWIENMRGQRIGQARLMKYLGGVKRMCDELEIYPSQLDKAWILKWIAKHPEMSDVSMRSFKVCARKWLKYAFNTSDEELKASGLDSKHVGSGKYATINLSEEQIAKGIRFLDERPLALLTFRLGTEVCMSKQEFLAFRPENLVEVEDGVWVLRTYRKKTKSYWTKYPQPETVALMRYGFPSALQYGEADFTNGLQGELRECYRLIQAQGDYFMMHPIHALRHVGAIRLLRKFNWNRALVAKLGGWEAEITLEEHYGAVPDELIHRAGKEMWHEPDLHL